MVTVLEVDLGRKRIALSMKEGEPRRPQEPVRQERRGVEKRQTRGDQFTNTPFRDALKRKTQ
jgi:ribosomal protein S1